MLMKKTYLLVDQLKRHNSRSVGRRNPEGGVGESVREHNHGMIQIYHIHRYVYVRD